MTRTLSYLVIIAVMITALGSNPTLVGSSLAQPEPSAEPSGTNTTISESLAKLGQSIRPGPNATMSEETDNTTMSEETEETQDIELENKSKTPPQGDSIPSKSCLKGTGPGTGKTCIPCNPASTTQGESDCPVLPLEQEETISKNESKPQKTLSSWFRSGLLDLEKEKTIPSGTSKAIQSFQKGDPSALIKICGMISNDPTADVKSPDCNSLQGKNGTESAEVSWIIAGWLAGKLLANADGNDENNNNDTSLLANTDGNGDDNNNDTSDTP